MTRKTAKFNRFRAQAELWRVHVYNNAELIDDGNEHDWHSLAYGFALGLGMPIEDAQNFALYISYETDMG